MLSRHTAHCFITNIQIYKTIVYYKITVLILLYLNPVANPELFLWEGGNTV